MSSRWDDDEPNASAPAALWDRAVLADIGSEDETADIRLLFTRQVGDALPLLQDAVRARDAGQIHALAHRLKGSALTVGAHRFARDCDALCTAARSGRLVDAVRLYAQVTDTWRLTAEEIERG